MFTDIVGYTALTQADEEHSLKLLERHSNIVRPFFPKFNGLEIKSIGDSFLVEFDSALNAAKCAIEIQKQLQAYNSTCGDNWNISLRIGVHLGDVLRNKGDIFGDAVNIASRIEPLAEPGGICISEQVFDQVHNKLPYELVQIEHKELKNVKMDISVYKVVLPWENEGSQKSVLQRDDMDRSGINRRVAVLPFSNMSPDPNDEYFADGITEEIISTISKIHGINVISRTSVMRYKKSAKSLKEIGDELDVGIVIEGSVRKAGNRIRVTVQMINAMTDTHFSSESYDRDLKDVFEIQSDIAQSVASLMKTHFLEQDKKRIERSSTRNPEAHNAYLLARYLINRGNKEDQEKGIESLQGAINLDPDFAQAYATLSICYAYMAGQYISDEEGFSRAKEYGLKAISLDDSSSEGHVSLGVVALQYDWDWERARKELTRAIELSPSSSEAHLWYGFYLGMMRRAEEGVQELRKAEELDPFSNIVKLNVGVLLYLAGKYDEAIKKSKEAIKLDKNSELCYLVIGFCYAAKSMLTEAINELLDGARIVETTNILGGLGYAFALAGKRNEALEALKKIEAQGERAFSPLTNVAMIYVGLGEYDEALNFLEKALDESESWLALTFQLMIYDPIRNSPRFLRIGEEIGLPLE